MPEVWTAMIEIAGEAAILGVHTTSYGARGQCEQQSSFARCFPATDGSMWYGNAEAGLVWADGPNVNFTVERHKVERQGVQT